MCHVREAVFLGEPSGDNVFRASMLGAGMAAMWPELPAFDVADPETLERLLVEYHSEMMQRVSVKRRRGKDRLLADVLGSKGHGHNQKYEQYGPMSY